MFTGMRPAARELYDHKVEVVATPWAQPTQTETLKEAAAIGVLVVQKQPVSMDP
jgi:hypothetical protein